MTGRAWIGWGILLGFALGGFFDGILLHQILQWHHLLSLVAGVDGLRAQLLWDGYFHALMYLLAAAALWGMWRNRLRVQGQGGRLLAGALLAGFGLWHVVDALLAHWLLGIHRIRLDAADPLLWDLLWLALFGLLPLVVAWPLLRAGPTAGTGRGEGTMAVLLAGLVAVGAAIWSLQAPPDGRFTTIVFAPQVTPAEAMNAVVAVDGRLVWSDPAMSVVVADVPAADAWHFYRRGALLVGGPGLPVGCLAWGRV